jgi:hypothetical protein
MKAAAALPRSAAREALRAKGQFWTPDDIADAMAAWACRDAAAAFDPAVGAGALLRAARRAAPGIALGGCEVDPDALALAADGGYPGEPADLVLADYTAVASGPHRAILANPPYLRHHRIDPAAKARLRDFAAGVVGAPIDARAGLHVYFLVKALSELAPGGRLCFLVPADVCEGVFAPTLWRWIFGRFRVEGAATFEPGSSPFPGVDTNALLLMVSARPPCGPVWWARVGQRGRGALARWCARGLGPDAGPGFEAFARDPAEALETGLSRSPLQARREATVPFGSLFRVVRGVVTGDNGFFLFDSRRAASLGIPASCLRRVIARTRDVQGDALDQADLERLDLRGRPTFMLDVPGGDMPAAVADYLATGSALGLPLRPSLAGRRPWWKPERREPPPWLFSYLGRRNCRFVRNDAAAVPLTSFLCVYPRDAAVDRGAAWRLLGDPALLAALPEVAKSYGDGALKVEPRALERLPLPCSAVEANGLAVRGAAA